MHPVSRAIIATLVLAWAFTSQAAEDFAACRQFFANGKPPAVVNPPTDRALCFDAFAILHSGESKTPVYVAEKLNRESMADAHEKRTNKFFADARLRSAERATLEDYKGTLYDPTAGTGGMLSVAGEHLASLNPDARLVMFGQELNPESFAICKADILIKGQDIANIILGNTLSNDGLNGKVFDYSLSNPPH